MGNSAGLEASGGAGVVQVADILCVRGAVGVGSIEGIGRSDLALWSRGRPAGCFSGWPGCERPCDYAIVRRAAG